MEDAWDLDDEPPAGHNTVKLAQALRGSTGSRQSLGQVVSRLSGSEPRADLSFPQTGPPPDTGGEEEDEEEEEWAELRDELVDFFASQSPADDAQGLYAAQKDAFERCMATVDCSEALAEGLAQTVRNLVELTVHLMGKVRLRVCVLQTAFLSGFRSVVAFRRVFCSLLKSTKCAGTESELLQAVARLEERRARHGQLKASLADRKKGELPEMFDSFLF